MVSVGEYANLPTDLPTYRIPTQSSKDGAAAPPMFDLSIPMGSQNHQAPHTAAGELVPGRKAAIVVAKVVRPNLRRWRLSAPLPAPLQLDGVPDDSGYPLV